MENLVSFIQNQFVASLNKHDVERVVDCFDDKATFSPTPPIPGMQTPAHGKEEIRKFFEKLLPGFHAEATGFKVDGDHVNWHSRITSDAFRNMGVDSLESDGSAVVRNNKIISFTPTFTKESATKLQSASQNVTGQGQRTGTGRTGSPR